MSLDWREMFDSRLTDLRRLLVETRAASDQVRNLTESIEGSIDVEGSVLRERMEKLEVSVRLLLPRMDHIENADDVKKTIVRLDEVEKKHAVLQGTVNDHESERVDENTETDQRIREMLGFGKDRLKTIDDRMARNETAATITAARVEALEEKGKRA